MAYNSAYTGPQVDAAVGAVQNKESTWDGKQDKLTGQSGQVVGFDAEGNAIAQTPPETGDVKADGSVPMTGDLNMGGHKITNLGAPTNANDAVRQADLKVVSDEVDGIISGTTGITLAPATTTKIGGVIVGDGIEVEADGTISVTPGLTQEQADGRYLQLNSDAMITGDVTFKYGADFDGSKITSVGTPVNGSDGANKAYVDSKAPTSVTVTLTVDGWTNTKAPVEPGEETVGHQQTVTVPGVVASEIAQLITPTPAILSQSAYYEAGIMCTRQAANSLTFTCQTVPTSNLTVYVVIQPLN